MKRVEFYIDCKPNTAGVSGPHRRHWMKETMKDFAAVLAWLVGCALLLSILFLIYYKGEAP